MQNQLLVESTKIVSAAVPIDITGAGFNGDYVSFKHYRKCAIILQTGAWAGGTAAVTLGQATTAAGGGAKALAMDYYYISTALTSDSLVKTAVTSNTFNLSAANKLVVIEVNAYDLDLANSFAWFRVEVATPGANADLASALYILYQGGLLATPSTLPTVIA